MQGFLSSTTLEHERGDTLEKGRRLRTNALQKSRPGTEATPTVLLMLRMEAWLKTSKAQATLWAIKILEAPRCPPCLAGGLASSSTEASLESKASLKLFDKWESTCRV